jgi:selenocysteine lyase/cysteine desulfurase
MPCWKPDDSVADRLNARKPKDHKMDTTRRQFVGLIGAAAALPAQPGAAATHTVRDELDFGEDRVPMNAANLCPSPRRVAAEVSRQTQVIDLDPSFQNRAQFAELLEQSRAAVAGQLGVKADEVALVRNTSEANNIINAGLDLRAGDEVVIWSQNHPTNHVAWAVRARRYGLVVKTVEVPPDPTSSDELIAPFEQAITPKTRVLTVTHVSNVSGLKLPIRALAQLCRTHGIHFHVDGAQTWGALSVDLADIGCDSFSGSAHKWFMGPKEVGLLYVKEDVVPSIWPSTVAPGWGEDAQTDLIGARKFESLGQRDDAALAAMTIAADLHERVGPENVERQMVHLAQRLKEGIVESGGTLVTPMDPAFSGGVCIAAVGPEHRGELWDRLYQEHGIIGAPTGGLRLCPHVYNTEEHVDRALVGIASLRHLLA